jgi:hypothetical protein
MIDVEVIREALAEVDAYFAEKKNKEGIEIDTFKVHFLVDGAPAGFVGYIGGNDDKGNAGIEFHLATNEASFKSIQEAFNDRRAKIIN